MSNVSDSIKIACDFLDAENLAETRDLVAEFRLHRIATKTGDDVLQLYNTLWHCWCSLSEQEEKVYSRASRVRPAHPKYPPMYHNVNFQSDAELHGSSMDPEPPYHDPLGDSASGSSFLTTQAAHTAEDSRSQAQGQQDIPLPDNHPTQASTRKSRIREKRKEKHRLEVQGLRIRGPPNLNCSCPICPRRFGRFGLIDHL